MTSIPPPIGFHPPQDLRHRPPDKPPPSSSLGSTPSSAPISATSRAPPTIAPPAIVQLPPPPLPPFPHSIHAPLPPPIDLPEPGSERMMIPNNNVPSLPPSKTSSPKYTGSNSPKRGLIMRASPSSPTPPLNEFEQHDINDSSNANQRADKFGLSNLSSLHQQPPTATTAKLPVEYCQPTNQQIQEVLRDETKKETSEASILPNDVIHINEVEWAEESTGNSNNDKKYSFEMAVRPRYTKKEDPCGCKPRYNMINDTMDTTPCCVDTSCVLFACQMECRSNCSAGDLCANNRITKRKWKKVQVIDARVKGLGLNTCEPLKKYDFVIEYTGVAIKREFLDSMFRRYKMERMLYIMALDNDVYIDARKKGSVARYVNHSCDPNCAVHRWKVRGISRAGIFAIRDIKEGEELSFDYKWKRKRGRAPTKCYCMSKNCRGTLEDMLTKSEEEENEEEELKDHWKEPLKRKGSGHEIMNRTIKIYSEEEDQYFIADVCKYDLKDRKHCLIYRGEIDETWEDLDTKKWLILDEQMEKFVIGRKAKTYYHDDNNQVNDSSDSRSVSPHPSNNNGTDSSTTKIKNYVIVQTPMKEKLASKFLVDRCQRHYRVQISVSCVYEASASDSDEALNEANALNDSLDRHAWKYSITGMNPVEAREYLEKNIADFEAELDNDDTATAVKSKEAEKFRHEIVVPRCVVDYVQERLPILKSNSKNAEIDFTASRSKSKQFAKLMIQSSDQYHASQAQIVLWKEVLTLCNAHGAPKTQAGLFKDLAFYGGELSQADFELLCPQISRGNINYDCCENLRETADMAAFEDFFRCTVWVQAVEDIGRINSKNQLEKESSTKRKIFFGCEPQRIPELWKHVENRIAEVSKGVQFYNVSHSKEGLLFMTKNFDNKPNGMPPCFFDYLNHVTGASVCMDNFCSSSIRIDEIPTSNNDPQVSSKELAEEIIKLQIELLRDNKIRQQRWGFGRDWALLVNEESYNEAEIVQNNNSVSSRPGNSRSLHRRYVVNVCMEISEINEMLGYAKVVAAHACIILYRYLNQVADETLKTSQTKQRDLSLACLFLASKCQKAFKWKRLETLLEGAHKVYYSGVRFDYKGEEGAVWEKRILSTEKDIVKKLDYDIFWPGGDWIIDCATASGHMKEPLAKKIMQLAMSGPVTASGPILWLKLGPEYAFAAMTALYCMDLGHLFSSLSINPLKVIDAVDLIVDSILSNRKIKQNASKSHEIFTKSRETFSTLKRNIKHLCEQHLIDQYKSDHSFHGNSKQYEIIARRSGRRRVFRGVDSRQFDSDLLSEIQKIRDQSQCTIYVEQGAGFQAENIIMEGTWRALAIAEYMLREKMPRFHDAEDLSSAAPVARGMGKSLYREYPGVISMSSVSAVNGWDDISKSGWKSKIGGKTCIPGKVQSKAFLNAGMRWWLNPKFIHDLNGSLCNMSSIRRTFQGNLNDHLKELSKIGRSMVAGDQTNGTKFPLLCPIGTTKNETHIDEEAFTAVSLHRWPPEKTEIKERSKVGMGVGVSPSALQEMQLLNNLHFLIPGPHGHPNFVLPIAIALEDDKIDKENTSDEKVKVIPDLLSGRTDDLLSLTFDNSLSSKSKKPKMKGSHLLFQPTPMILQRVMSRGKRRKNDRPEAGFIPPTILTAWFHDLLSSIAHCHTNYVVLRTLHPDQILIDNSGVAKMSGLTRSVVLHPNDRERYLDPISSTKIKGKKSSGITEEDISSNPYMAPELLLGANRYTQQSDIWTLACLFAHLMIGKPFFSGRDRKSKMRAIFKIVGSSSSSNYKDAQTYPYYDTCKTDKKYKSGVEKALRYMFKDSEANADSYACILQLLEKMLVLDPRKRMSALDALEHPSMTDFMSKTTCDNFREQYVKDWMVMRDMLSSEDDGNGTGSASATSMGIEAKSKRTFDTMQSRLNNTKDVHVDVDDLYNDMDWKRPRKSG